jgi:hypothetical protein
MVVRWKEGFSLLNSLENFMAKRYLLCDGTVLGDR